MESKQKNKRALVILVVILLLGALYWFVIRDNGDAVPSESNTILAEANVTETEVILLLEKMRAINLRKTIFDDPVFQSLRNFKQEADLFPTGRPNPFAPVGSSR